MFASIMRGTEYFTRKDRRNVVFLLCTHTEVVNGLDCKSIVREFESHCVLINIKQMVE